MPEKLKKTAMPSVGIVSLNEKAKERKVTISREEKEIFANHLKYFIEGLTQNENEQKKILNIAVAQFKGQPIQKAKQSCASCYGRGFKGFNRTYQYFEVCNRCFKF